MTDIDDKVNERIEQKHEQERAEGIYLDPAHFLGYSVDANKYRYTNKEGKISFYTTFDEFVRLLRDYAVLNNSARVKWEKMQSNSERVKDEKEKT